MLSPLVRFLFPKVCLYCKEVDLAKGLLCERCLVGLDLMYPKGLYANSFYEPSPWYRMGGVFCEGSAAEVLLYDIDRFAKEIAAFFVIQYIRLRWSFPDAFYVDPLLRPIEFYIPKFLDIKCVSKRRDYSGKRVLYFVKDHTDCKIPEFLLGARIFLLSYSYPER